MRVSSLEEVFNKIGEAERVAREAAELYIAPIENQDNLEPIVHNVNRQMGDYASFKVLFGNRLMICRKKRELLWLILGLAGNIFIMILGVFIIQPRMPMTMTEPQTIYNSTRPVQELNIGVPSSQLQSGPLSTLLQKPGISSA